MTHLHYSERKSDNCETLTLLSGVTAFSKHLQLCAEQTLRTIDILSEDLDKQLFSNDRICDMFSKVARAHRQSRVRILVKKPLQLVQSYHQLVTLQQKLSSKIEIRALNGAPENHNRCYVIFDACSLLLQHEDGQYDGFCNTQAKLEARALLEEYELLWGRHSNAIEELRSLRL